MGGKSPMFDEARPWNFVFRQAANDEAFWQKELVEPAMLVLSRSAALKNVVTGESPTLGLGAPSGSSAQPAPKSRPVSGGLAKTRAQPGPKKHELGSDGNLLANRR
eukprot:6466805-Amphidinium_carterae.1